MGLEPYYEDAKAGIVIYHGDSSKVLPLLDAASVDLVLTDPPYELVATGGGIGAQRKYMADIVGFTDGGFDMSLLAPFANWVCFASKEQLPNLLGAVGDRRWMLVTWNKMNPTPLTNNNYLPDTEYIVHAFASGRLFGEYRDKSRFILHPIEKNGFSHPNVKPLAVISKMVRLGTVEGEMILDPFMGSGTTLRAAKDLGRKAIGIEIEERYCEMAAERLRQGVLDFGN
jgi:site-specific DNA-methyltransferase (adenine-specific)